MATAAIAQPKTVLYLDHTAKWSGGEIALLRLLEAVDLSRVHPIVLLAEEGPFAEKLREVPIETRILPLSGTAREVRKDSLGAGAIFRHAGSLLAFLQYSIKVAKVARETKATVLHCNSLKADLYGAIAGRIARVPVLWHVRDHIDPSYLPGPAVKAFRALAQKLPTYVVTNSDSTTEKLFPQGVGKQSCRAVHDGLVARELTTARPPVTGSWKKDPPRVGILGRIVPWKGQHIFLEAAKQLTEQGINAHFVLIGAPLFGEQAYEAQLHEQAKSVGGNRVEFMGFRRDIPEILRGLDILVHASTTPEPFGQVVIEGMAEGLPVVASEGGGVREIIRSGDTGLLTPMGDADALARALAGLLTDPAHAQHLAQAGWDAVRENFTAAQSARKIESVYDEIWSGRRGRAVKPRDENSTQTGLRENV